MPINSPARLAQVAEAAQLWGKVFDGNRRAALDVAEALSTSDFQQATGDVLHRELLARYDDIPQVWSQFAKRTTVRDFKPKTLVDLLGGKAALDAVPELTDYPGRAVSKATYQLSVGKYGGRFAISWESIVNDELGELRNLPENLAQAARDTEDRTATATLAQTSGINTSFFKAGNGNLISGNPALSADAIDAALTAISVKKDSEGRPIVVRAAVLVVPPALETTANRILSAQWFERTVGGVTVRENNFLAGRVRLVVNPWLPVINTSGTTNSTWYVLPDPAGPRPAVALGFLAGHEQPDLRVKADAGSRVGGGAIAAEEGSFDVDDVQYRVRHVLGAANVDPIATAVSNGSGS